MMILSNFTLKGVDFRRGWVTFICLCSSIWKNERVINCIALSLGEFWVFLPTFCKRVVHKCT